MPGILPMKVIKVGTNAQSRIAQACDRCRSKKIRCDGVRPCCTQCANVGFECKTSDKLSRRAFPRGYTESLEERVRSLECEVRELKDLLDEKDEKIEAHADTLEISAAETLALAATTVADPETSEKDEVFKVQQSPYPLAGGGDRADSYFAGTSSSRTFIEAFKHKVQESGRSTADVSTDLLLTSSLTKGSDAPPTPASPVVWKAPPRLVSDQLVNIFFQEWAPLFPVLHRPTFLDLYEKYVADPEAVTDKTAVAQLNLVFGIATLSSGTRTSVDLESFEVQLRAAIDAILSENTMGTLQALILAQIFCVHQGDYTRLLSYKGLSMTLSARLGLHQSQKRFALGTLTCETRKKVFWTLYTVDSFTAVTLGLPKQLKDDDVNCEYPVDADDEYVTERGFKPTLPGESTKLSSALALFRAARILSKILEDVFPAKTSYELSMKKLGELSDELDAWRKSLAPHLRLEFAQDKPSTGTISSRSPLLSLTYHYIRALIQRPAVCASLGSRSSSSTMTMASSCKSVVQIIQLLEERGMCFAFCLNKDELLVLSGFGLLFQGLELDPGSRILKDNQKTITRIIGVLDSSDAPCAPEFRRVARSFLPTPPSPSATQPRVLAPPSRPIAATPTPKLKAPTLPRHSSDSAAILVNPIPSLPASTRKQLKAIASRFSISGGVRPPKFDVPIDQRRATIHNISLHAHGEPSRSQPSLAPPTAHSPATTSRSEPARSPSYPHHRASSVLVRPSAPPQQPSQQQQQPKAKPKPAKQNLANLDYLSFGPETNAVSTPQVPWTVKKEPQPTDWEKLLGSLDNGPTNIYDACYGGRPVEALDITPLDHQTNLPSNAINPADDSAVWTDAATADLWALCQTETNTSEASAFTESNSNGHPDSIFSFASSEGRKSSDDFTTADWGSASSASEGDVYKGICMPADLGQEVDVQFGSAWDGGLNL
ncbi:DNA-binding transcription factor cat8 [Friedmanniomyces endolithicus]|uniref:DNA-binding transcription factor cat8 n=1 Tax=Friedmanniomyces endolithicus TaxID=329885 RepID=A0AAN6JX17_9PEZI|nr:DNA-binding transcription factor cat8 [Friedmanniomyces endolithicus]